MNAAKAKVDQAAAANALAADQAATLKPKIAIEIGVFVNRPFKHLAPLRRCRQSRRRRPDALNPRAPAAA